MGKDLQAVHRDGRALQPGGGVILIYRNGKGQAFLFAGRQLPFRLALALQLGAGGRRKSDGDILVGLIQIPDDDGIVHRAAGIGLPTAGSAVFHGAPQATGLLQTHQRLGQRIAHNVQRAADRKPGAAGVEQIAHRRLTLHLSLEGPVQAADPNAAVNVVNVVFVVSIVVAVGGTGGIGAVDIQVVANVHDDMAATHLALIGDQIAGLQELPHFLLDGVQLLGGLLISTLVIIHPALQKIHHMPGQIGRQVITKGLQINGAGKARAVQKLDVLAVGALGRQALAAAGGQLQHAVHAALVVLHILFPVIVGSGQRQNHLLFQSQHISPPGKRQTWRNRSPAGASFPGRASRVRQPRWPGSASAFHP